MKQATVKVVRRQADHSAIGIIVDEMMVSDPPLIGPYEVLYELEIDRYTTISRMSHYPRMIEEKVAATSQ